MPTLALVRRGELVASYRLDAPVVVVGRDDACGITLKGPLVSREHCKIVARDDGYVVQDLGSINGTYVNGKRVKEQELREGDRIAVVPHILVYHATDRETDGAPTAPEDEPSADMMATTRLDASEVNRHLSELLAGAKPYGFSVSHEVIGDDVDVVRVAGPLDAHTSDGLEEAINLLLAKGRCRIIVEMAGVNYLASAGVGVLLSATDEARAIGGNLVLLNPTSQAQGTLDLGFTEMLAIATDRQEALSMLRPEG